MHLTPREQERLFTHYAGALAKERKQRGLKLNYPEAIAYITAELLELARDGLSVTELMRAGTKLLKTDDLLDGVPEMIHEIQLEATFPDGTKLVTVHEPIPPSGAVGTNVAVGTNAVHPGEFIFDGEPITINAGKKTVELTVVNTGDRPVQVGSHFHFFEVNKALDFDRAAAFGMRLDIPSGTAVRFEPGDSQKVRLVEIGGARLGLGLNSLTNGNMDDPKVKSAAIEKAKTLGFKGADSINNEQLAMSNEWKNEMSRRQYASMFGPTTGDRIRLGDTSIIIEVEKDFTVYGEEAKFGGGKSLRDGMGQACGAKDGECPDLVITNAVILDYTGIIKADIGIKDGKICAVGKAGNPDIMDGVTKGLTVGASTEIIAGEGLIVTAGGIDTHIHFISPTQIETALYSGVTTMIGGGTGPADGTNATTCTPGRYNIEKMLEAAEGYPVNLGFLGKGNSADVAMLNEQIEAGACGLKLHEDWGSTPATIKAALDAGDKYDVQVAIHTDTLNEGGFVEDTLAAIGGRVIHTYHTEGAGGGHAPDIIRAAALPNILPSSTNPTMPFTVNTVDEHLDMLMVCHHLDSKVPEDVAFADSRIRPETIAAEDMLHDMGIFSMMSSDSQAMGRVGEVILRTWQTASKMKDQRGTLSEDNDRNDNFRAKRYIAKYTINPAITHGIDDYVGSLEAGKFADLVIWKPSLFGAKPEMIIKGGFIIASKMGDANASIPTPQPVMYRNMFGASDLAQKRTCLTFVSKVASDNGIAKRLGLQRTVLPVKNCRTLTKADMKFNDRTGDIKVDPETYTVTVDGEKVTCEPADRLPLAQRYFLF